MKIFASCNMPSQWVQRFSSEFEFDFHDWGANKALLPRDEFLARLAGCPVLITEFDDIDAAVMDANPDLAAIVDCRGTPVNIDIDAATQRGIAVMNTPGRNADAVADLTAALMVMIARGLLPAIRLMESGGWEQQGFKNFYLSHLGREVAGTTVGLIGVGAVGRKVAYRLRGFDVNLLGFDPYVKQADVDALGIQMMALDDLLQQSDFVSLHAPITPQTTGMIGAREFGLMKPTAYFVNTARAVLVDEQALINAVTNERIAGAALDVFHQEPLPTDYPLLGLPNVVAIPHLGGATVEVAAHHSRIAYDSIQGLLRGEPINVVNQPAFDRAHERLSNA